jgi:hypothetical protein
MNPLRLYYVVTTQYQEVYRSAYSTNVAGAYVTTPSVTEQSLHYFISGPFTENDADAFVSSVAGKLSVASVRIWHISQMRQWLKADARKTDFINPVSKPNHLKEMFLEVLEQHPTTEAAK